MTKEIINSVLLAGLFLSLFGIAEILYHKLKIKADDTRKIVHIGTGLLTILFPLMLGNHWFVLLLCVSFALILFLSLKFNLLPSINAIDRISYGSLWYPVAVYTCYLAYNYFHNNLLFFYLPVLTMAICDPVAAFFGKRWPYGKFHIKQDTKTVMGSAAFFFASVILTIVLFYLFSSGNFRISNTLLIALLIAAATTVTEALSTKGLDNITIPVCVVLILTLVHD
jgi:dolichol kinase